MVRGLDCGRDHSSDCMKKQLGDRQETGLLIRTLSQIPCQELMVVWTWLMEPEVVYSLWGELEQGSWKGKLEAWP